MAKTVKKAKKKTTAKKKTVKPKSKTKAKVGKKNKGGRKTTLTTAIATQLARMWRHKISDQIAIDVIGITKGQLDQWLRTNQVVDITIVKTDKAGIKKYSTENIGLHTLRARERAFVLYDYMELHKQAIDGAMANDQYKAALGGTEWLMEKQFPKVFGKDPGGDDEDKPKAVKFPLAPPPKKKKPKAKPAKKSKK